MANRLGMLLACGDVPEMDRTSVFLSRDRRLVVPGERDR